MIFETELIKQKLKEKSYIGEIIFTRDENIINEAFNIETQGFKIYARNKIKENIHHHRTFKLKSRKFSNNYKYGISIIFDKIIDGYDSDRNEIYHFEWDIDPDIYSNKSDKRKIIKLIGEDGFEFINKALLVAGNDMIEYWSLNPKKDNKRINELENKYQGYRI